MKSGTVKPAKRGDLVVSAFGVASEGAKFRLRPTDQFVMAMQTNKIGQADQAGVFRHRSALVLCHRLKVPAAPVSHSVYVTLPDGSAEHGSWAGAIAAFKPL